MDTIYYISLINKKLSGTLAAYEAAILTAWLAEDAGHRAVFASVQAIHRADWKQLSLSPSPEFFERQRARVHELITAVNRKEADARRKSLRLRRTVTTLLAAASVVFITLITLHRFSPQHRVTAHVLKTVSSDSTHVNFNQVTLGDALHTLEAAYGKTLLLDDRALLTTPFTGIFVHEDLESILLAVCKSLHLSYTRHGNTYVLKRLPDTHT